MEVEGPNSGVVIKLKGHASVDPATGRITAVFDEIPQFPFSKFTVTTASGSRSPLTNPQACGAARSEDTLTPWSYPGTAPATASDLFQVDWDGAGGACPASAPFSLGFAANVRGRWQRPRASSS